MLDRLSLVLRGARLRAWPGRHRPCLRRLFARRRGRRVICRARPSPAHAKREHTLERELCSRSRAEPMGVCRGGGDSLALRASARAARAGRRVDTRAPVGARAFRGGLYRRGGALGGGRAPHRAPGARGGRCREHRDRGPRVAHGLGLSRRDGSTRSIGRVPRAARARHRGERLSRGRRDARARRSAHHRSGRRARRVEHGRSSRARRAGAATEARRARSSRGTGAPSTGANSGPKRSPYRRLPSRRLRRAARRRRGAGCGRSRRRRFRARCASSTKPSAACDREMRAAHFGACRSTEPRFRAARSIRSAKRSRSKRSCGSDIPSERGGDSIAGRGAIPSRAIDGGSKRCSVGRATRANGGADHVLTTRYLRGRHGSARNEACGALHATAKLRAAPQSGAK